MTIVACSSIESSTNRTMAGCGAFARPRHCRAELPEVITLWVARDAGPNGC
jgi:hypothetical protein